MGAYSNEESQDCSCCTRHLCWIIAVVVGLGFAAFIWYVVEDSVETHYDIVITGVSGLTNPVSEMKQGGVLLNPVFNISVGVASKSSLYGACIDPKTVIKVFYSEPLLPLAAGRVPSMCVGPRKSSGLRPVVATGSNVPMPGFLIDNLRKEISNGEAMFFVKLDAWGRDRRGLDGWWSVMHRWVGLVHAATP